MKHNKGPWKIYEHEAPLIFAWDDEAQESTAVASICTIETTEEENKANAALISASPELLEGLEIAVNFFNQNGGDTDYT